MKSYDPLDIRRMLESALDGFAEQFAGCPFDQLAEREKRKLLMWVNYAVSLKYTGVDMRAEL